MRVFSVVIPVTGFSSPFTYSSLLVVSSIYIPDLLEKNCRYGETTPKNGIAPSRELQYSVVFVNEVRRGRKSATVTSIVHNISVRFSQIEYDNMVFEQEFIFGRTVFVCERINILTENLHSYVTSEKGAASAPDECYRLFFPHICDRDYKQKWSGNNSVTGIVVLEGLMSQAICTLQVTPFSMLVFHCDVSNRNSILQEAEFTNNDLTTGRVEIIWFSKEEVRLLHNDVLQNEETYCHSWDMLWSMVCEKWLLKHMSANLAPLPQFGYHFQLWNVQSIIDRWSKAVGHWLISEGDYNQLPRTLIPLEHMWLYFHISLRWRRDVNVDRLSMTYIINNIRVKNVYNLDPRLMDDNIARETKINPVYHGMMSMLTGAYRGLTDELLTCYVSLCKILVQSKTVFKVNLSDTMQGIRRKYHSLPLFTSCKLKTFTETSIDTIPSSVLDLEAVTNWSLERKNELQTEMDTKRIFKRVYSDAVPVMKGGNQNFLRLYGNLSSLLDVMKKHDSRVTNIVYKVECLGALSSATVGILPLYGMHGKMRQNSPFHIDEENSLTSIRLLEALEFCTPIWTTPTKTGMNFMRITPMLDRKRKLSCEVGNVDDLIERHMYPIESDRHDTAEYLQSGLHWSLFVADIDIKPLPGVPRPDRNMVARDLVTMFDDIFETVFGFKVRGHFVFASIDDGSEKLGLHHHAIMPPGLVLTTTACRDIAKILEIVRRMYPETIGVNTADDTPVFDTLIYPVMHGQNHKGHCLRGPLQTKSDGTRKLECIYQTETPLSLRHMLIHGPQFNENGERVIFGKIIESIQGIYDLSDLAFFKKYEAKVMNDNMKSICQVNVKDIMKEINNKCVLFDVTSVENNVDHLLSILNNLWSEEGGKNTLISRLKSAVGSEGKKYEKRQILLVDNRSKFIHDTEHGTINLVTDNNAEKLFPFCPRRPHRKRTNKGVRITVGYSSRMIRFILFVSRCYKLSCQEKRVPDRTSHFIPDVVLTMPDVFVCPMIRRDVERFLQHNFRGPTVGVIEIYRRPSDDKEERKIEVETHTEEIVHRGDGVFHYIHEGTFLSSTRNLFMFLPNNVPGVLVFGLTNNTYVACMKNVETNARKCNVYVSSSYALILAHLTENMMLKKDLLQQLKETMQNE